MSWSVVVQSGSILLREGLEATLIVAILAGALRKAGAEAALRGLAYGVGAAVVASIAAAVIFEIWFGGGHDDRVEAAVITVAAALMFYMSGWLWRMRDPGAAAAALRANAARTAAQGALWPAFALAFASVFREGAETALFLHAVAQADGGWSLSVALGMAAAAALLGLGYVVLQRAALRIPLRPAFALTSAAMFLMGLRFVGAAIQELQEQQLFAYDEAPFGGALAALGFNPTWEAVGVQFALLALAGVGLALSMKAKPVKANGPLAAR
jgi:high-affinity iron transporter